MFDDYLERFLSRGAAWFYGITIGGAIAMLALSSWLYWHYEYLNPQTVFWGAVSSSLTTEGVTKRTRGNDNNGQLDQYDQISLGANNFVSSTANISQGSTKVTTETIGTPVSNFARYTKIEAANAADYSSVINQWGKQDLGGSNASNGVFADTIFGIMPLAHLNANQRRQVIDEVRREGTYTVDFAAVGKQRKDGRLYYEYNLSVAPDKYVKLLKQVDELMGLNQLKNLNPAQYQGGQPIQFKVSIDAHAHQLAVVQYGNNGRQEAYSAWGVARNPNLPTNTISQTDLQAKLKTILNGQ